MSTKRQYVPITPGGTVCFWLTSNTQEEAWNKLLQDAAHIPYDSIAEMRQRGYRVEVVREVEVER